MILRKQKARDSQLRNSSFLILPLSLIIFQQVVGHEYESHVNSHLTLTSQMTSYNPNKPLSAQRQISYQSYV